MKNYTRKQISTDDIDAYSMCPKFYELSKDKTDAVDENNDDIFRRCIQETILQLWVMTLSTGHKAEFNSVKLFFDKIFYKAFSDDTLITKALEYTEKGLDILYQYYSTIYSMSDNKVVAVRAPYDFTVHCEKIAVPIELELVSVDQKNSDVYVMVFTDKETVPEIKEEAMTSASHMIKMSSIFKETPSNHTVKITFYNAEKSIGYTIEITDEIVKDIDKKVKYIIQGIHNNVYYKSKTGMCDSCAYIKECDRG